MMKTNQPGPRRGFAGWALPLLCGVSIALPAFSLSVAAQTPQTAKPAQTAPSAQATKPAPSSQAAKPAPSSTAAKSATDSSSQNQRFPTADEAVKTLIATVKKGDLHSLLAIFGQDGKELLQSSEPATARMNQQVFTVAAAEQWHLTDDAANRKTLVIGNEDWPFPVPLVKDAKGWRFDTAAGKEEVIARRIGHNELATIA